MFILKTQEAGYKYVYSSSLKLTFPLERSNSRQSIVSSVPFSIKAGFPALLPKQKIIGGLGQYGPLLLGLLYLEWEG